MMFTYKEVEVNRETFCPPYAGRIVHPAHQGEELNGTALQQLAQTNIHRSRDRIWDMPGVCSFGRSVAAFLPEFDGRDLNELVEDFQRVLVLGPSNRLDAVTQQTVGMGAEVSCIMPIVSVEESVYMPKAIARLDSMRAHLKGAYVPLLPDARRNQIRAVQQLQKDVGLTPLPGALLRGYHGSVATTILEDERGELLAAATCVGLSDVGADYADTAILLGVSVSPNAQGRGLGSGLTAVSLITARTMLGARRVIGVVHPDNAAAFRTNARFGMLPAGGLGAQYVELERTL